MSLKDNFNQAVKEILRKDGLVGDDLSKESKKKSDLDRYIDAPQPEPVQEADYRMDSDFPDSDIAPEPELVPPPSSPYVQSGQNVSQFGARPSQGGGDPYAGASQQQGQGFPNQGFQNQGFQNQGYGGQNQGYNQQNQGFPNQGYGAPNAGYASDRGYGAPNNGMGNMSGMGQPSRQDGYNSQNQGFGGGSAGFGNQGYPNQGYGNQSYSSQGYGNQGFGSASQGFGSAGQGYGGGNIPPAPPSYGGNEDSPYYETEETTVISRNTIVNGNIRSFANVAIDGSVKGDVRITKNISVAGKVVGDVECNDSTMTGASMQGNLASKGRVQMDRDTIILGDISAQYLDLNGKIKGNLDIGGKAEFKTDAIVMGNITASTITVLDGATIQGYVNTTFLQESSSNIFPEAIAVTE